jgi:glycosyltransferase involved in cell wall biosynthesis
MLVPYAVSFGYPIFRGLNRWLIRWYAQRATTKLGIRNPAVFIFSPYQNFLMGTLNEQLLCYEIPEEYTLVPGVSKKLKMRIKEEEQETLAKADIVFTATKGLQEKKSYLCPRTYFIPNSANPEDFMKSQDPNTEIPPEIEEIPSPRLGYIGNINDRLNLELINSIARNHPDWSIVLIGRLDGTRRFVRSQKFIESHKICNIHYLGWRQYDLIPNYLKGIDVCLIPWLEHKLTGYYHPNKLYQYLAAGKPIVVTDILDVDGIDSETKKLISIARNEQEFEQMVSSALKDSNEPELVEERLRVARLNSAEKRAIEKLEIIEFWKKRLLA